jgi:multiple sugar transport system permease protein
MVVTSFKQNADLYVGATNTAHNPFIFNMAPTLDHLRILFGQTLYLTWLRNTFVVGALVVAITLVLAVPAGYSLARLTGRWGERLSIGIFLTYLVPSTLLFIPFSRLVSLLKLQNQLASLVLIYPTFTVPFCTWLLMGFFKSLPKEVEESAMVDGCSRVGAIWRMVLPLSVPGLLTVVIFALTLVIQEFVYSLTFISSVERMTVSVGVPVALVRGDVYYWGSLMAACLITSVPIAVVYNFFLDRFIAGFTVGAIK